jgi:alkylation response protein AidB-like acyl-CoA dehydrogenase
LLTTYALTEQEAGSDVNGMKSVAREESDRFILIGQAAFDIAFSYAKKRTQFGSSIATFQAIQLKLAEMATELDAARALVYRAAILKDKGEANVSRQASMAKFFATEAAFRTVDQGVQIHGGIGVMHGSVIERLYREIRALRIYDWRRKRLVFVMMYL